VPTQRDARLQGSVSPAWSHQVKASQKGDLMVSLEGNLLKGGSGTGVWGHLDISGAPCSR
jgi:hypothetical protein